MSRLVYFITILILIIFCSTTVDSYSAARFRMPKQGYAKQAGGNARQKTRVEYDRGGQHISREVKPGQTNFIPKDARNVRINGLQVKPSTRATISPKGATLFDD